jgi:hypothetical protein
MAGGFWINHARSIDMGKRLFVFSFGCRSYFLQIWCRLYFLSVFGHQSIFYGSSKGCLYFLVIFFELFSRIRPKTRDRWLESRARKQSTGAHPSIRRDSTQRSVHGAGGTRRTRASRAAGSRQRGWRRGTRKWAAHAAQRRRARDAGLLMMSVRRDQNRRISPRVRVSRGVVNLENQSGEL